MASVYNEFIINYIRFRRFAATGIKTKNRPALRQKTASLSAGKTVAFSQVIADALW